MSSTVAIIAGAGHFPMYAAQAAKRQGLKVVGVGLRGWVDPALASQVDVYEEIAVGQLRRLVEYLKAQAVHQAIMAGKVTKEVFFDERHQFDAQTLAVLSQVKSFSVDALLGAVATHLAGEGIVLLDSSTFLKANLCPVGPLTSRGPTPIELGDIGVGQHAARAVANVDIGQTVVVKDRVVVAVEALEGTDAAIRRAHTLAGGGLVVVKVASAQQDHRFDLPVIGPHTITTLKDAHVSCLAVEAGTTLLLDRHALVADADAAGICLVGITIPASSTAST